MPSLDFELEKRNFKEFYTSNFKLLESAAESFKLLFSSLILHHGIDVHHIAARIKNSQECIDKFARKYQQELEEAKKSYEIKDHITDIIGIRIVCLYASDIEIIGSLIEDQFEVVSKTDKIKQVEQTESVFGYKGLHYDLRLNTLRKDLPEYKSYTQLQFELQIRTVIIDAWSVLDHKIKYKKSIPIDLSRRITQLAVWFDSAEQEFGRIKNAAEDFREKAKEQVSKIQSIPGQEVPLDVFTFIEASKSFFPEYEFLPFKVDGFINELFSYEPDLNTQVFISVLSKNLPIVQKYAAFQREKYFNTLNPFTLIRHSFYLHESQKFKGILFDLQRKNFEEWLTHNKRP